MPRLVLVNSYSAGSHALWERGLEEHLPKLGERPEEVWSVDVVRLPGRHWKWRMHSAGWTMVQRMKESGQLKQPVDVFLVTDMLDVGQFRAALPAEHRSTPIALYFHENQLTFPDHPERPPLEWDRHYAFLNLTSALLADAVWFNSEYHRLVFLDSIPEFLRQLPSPRPVQPHLEIERKSQVLPIGLEPDCFRSEGQGIRFGEGPPVIAWNHRWEHDKGPRAFLDVLRVVRDHGARFRLCVLGQSFEDRPAAFDALRSEFEDDIVHWGFAASRSDYLDLLASCDIALVTAHHDFYGISVLESAALGLHIVAPAELAYSDHFPKESLHARTDLANGLMMALEGEKKRIWKDAAARLSWSQVTLAWHEAMNEVGRGNKLSAH